jgi:hypothetical protein
MQYVITTPHTSRYPNPVELSRGDRVVLGKRDTEYPGWFRIIDQRGNEGWAPKNTAVAA